MRLPGEPRARAHAPTRDLLAERAMRYAEVGSGEQKVLSTVVTFRRGQGAFALDLTALREVRPLSSWCRIPGARVTVPGLVHYRGELLTLNDLAPFLGETPGGDEPGWVLVVDDGSGRVGLMADDVMDVIDIPVDALSPVPLTLGEPGECFQGVIEDQFLMIDPPRLLSARALAAAF